MGDWIEISALIIATMAVILVIIIHVFVFHESYRVRNEGLKINVQQGGVNIANDTFNTGGEGIYICNSGIPMTLTIASSTNNLIGRQIYIKNNTSATVTLDTSQLSGYNSGNLPAADQRIVKAGQYSTFVFIGTNNLLRLD